MKKIFLFLSIASFVIWNGCEPETPTAPKLETTPSQAALSKMVAVGSSITAGFQSSGLMKSFQENSYPYLIAKQMGRAADFMQPLIAAPGIGSPAGKTPQSFNPATGEISQDDLTVNPLILFLQGGNAELPRPYDNLGVPGAVLNDILNTTSTPANPFFDLVLRNPNLGNTTMLEQAIALQPTLFLLWIGNDDVLGAALAGGGVDGNLLPALITSQNDFQTRLTTILTRIRFQLRSVLMLGNIPNVTDIPYVNFMDIAFHTIPALGINTPVPVIFNETFQPVDFDQTAGVMYLPLVTEEENVSHVLLPALLQYQTGVGVPDSAYLRTLGLSSAMARALVAGMIAGGLNPTGQPIPGNLTLTVTEATEIANAVTGFNQIISSSQIKNTFVYNVVDINSLLNELNTDGIGGLSGNYVLRDPGNTAFSLDGVHPNNAGNAVIANEFISGINAALQVTIPPLTLSEYAGQYLGKKPSAVSLKSSFDGVRGLFVK